MTERIRIETVVPKGTEVADARRAARLQAAEALGIHITEEQCLPLQELVSNKEKEEKMREFASRSVTEHPSPEEMDAVASLPDMVPNANDHTVDRVLVTWWSPTK